MMMNNLPDCIKDIYDKICQVIRDCIDAYLPESNLSRSLLVGTTAGFLAYCIFKKRYHLPPGPRALPLVGHLLFLRPGKENLGRSFLRLSKIYGPVFTLYQGPFPVVVLNDINVINEALVKRSEDFSDRWVRQTFKLNSCYGENIVFGSYNSGWKLRRKITAKAFRSFLQSGRLNTNIEDVISITVKRMLMEDKPFDPLPFIFYLTLNTLAAMCFGTRYEYDSDEYRVLFKLIDDLLQSIGEGINLEDFIPLLRLFPCKRYKLTQKVSQDTIDFIEKNLKDHKTSFREDNISDLMFYLLKSQKDLQLEDADKAMQFQDKHIVAIISDILLAGNDTTRQTMHWALLFICAHSDVQSKIQEEVDRVVGRDRYPCISDRGNLPYTNAVIHEVIRLGTTVPVGVPHLTSRDTKIGEYDVPKNTTVFINHWGLHNNPDNWTEVDVFKPERYLDINGQMAPKPENWLPFGAGRRVCVGETLAKPELHLIIAALFQRLNMSLEPGKSVNLEAEESHFAYSAKPYKITVKQRYA